MKWTILACVLSSIPGLVAAWVFYKREQAAKEDRHLSYLRGFDASSRIRDREEVQERKAALLFERDFNGERWS